MRRPTAEVKHCRAPGHAHNEEQEREREGSASDRPHAHMGGTRKTEEKRRRNDKETSAVRREEWRINPPTSLQRRGLGSANRRKKKRQEGVSNEGWTPPAPTQPQGSNIEEREPEAEGLHKTPRGKKYQRKQQQQRRQIEHSPRRRDGTKSLDARKRGQKKDMTRNPSGKHKQGREMRKTKT